jgi:hypothetical protein
LDPQFGPGVRWRFVASLPSGDAAEIRRWARRNEEVNASGDFMKLDRILTAHALGEPITIEPTDVELPAWHWYLWSIVNGLSLKPVELAISEHSATLAVGSRRHTVMQEFLWKIRAIRGRASPPPASLIGFDPGFIIHVAIADSQFAPMATGAAAELERSATTAERLCYRELWRVHNGDTTTARRAIAGITAMVSQQDPGPFPRVGRFGVCTRLLAAMVEARAPPTAASPALDSLEALTRRGPGIELPTTLANLFVIRQRSARGEHRRAYESARRLPFYHASPSTVIATPALLREEGRLALILGDTVAAIRAYGRLLVLRDDAAGGPLSEDVARVQAALAALVVRK